MTSTSTSAVEVLKEAAELLLTFGCQRFQWPSHVSDDHVVIDNRESLVTVGTYRRADKAWRGCISAIATLDKGGDHASDCATPSPVSDTVNAGLLEALKEFVAWSMCGRDRMDHDGRRKWRQAYHTLYTFISAAESAPTALEEEKRAQPLLDEWWMTLEGDDQRRLAERIAANNGCTLSPIPAPGASWTEALKFIAEQPDPQVHTVTSLFYKMRDRARAALASLNATPPAQGHGAVGAGWRPIESAPRDGTSVLVYWPCVEIDENGDLTGNAHPEPGLIGVSRNTQGGWEKADCLNAVGHYFDDDFEYGEPTYWHPLPAAPDAAPAQPEAAEMPGRVELARTIFEQTAVKLSHPRLGIRTATWDEVCAAHENRYLDAADAIIALLSQTAKA